MSSASELQPLRAVMHRAAEAGRLWIPEVERALGLPRGGWDQLLTGKRVLRVRHLVALARLLRVPPADFLEIGLAKAARAADQRLADWLAPARPQARSAASLDDLQARIDAAVRRELGAAQDGGKRARG